MLIIAINHNFRLNVITEHQLSEPQYVLSRNKRFLVKQEIFRPGFPAPGQLNCHHLLQTFLGVHRMCKNVHSSRLKPAVSSVASPLTKMWLFAHIITPAKTNQLEHKEIKKRLQLSRSVWFGAGREDMEKKSPCGFDEVAALPWSTSGW